MKKSKLLMPLAGIAAVGAVAPIAVMATSCNKGVSASNADKEYLTKINDFMKYGEDYVAPHKAIEALKDIGFDVINYKLSNNALEFAFDASVKKFIIMNGDAIVASPAGYAMANSQVVFKFTNKYDKNSRYGQYLLDNYDWEEPTKQFDIATSIDFGNNTHIKNLNYVGSTNAEGKTVLLRTYGEYLNICSNNDTIYHMGVSNNINVYGTSASKQCKYMELGKVAYLYLENVEIQVAKITTAVDSAQVDLLEAEKGVTKGGIFNEKTVTLKTGNQKIKDVSESNYIATTTVNDAKGLYEAIIGDSKVIRLGKNIDITDEVMEQDKSIAITDKTFVLDLAGKTLTDKVDTKLKKAAALFDICAADEDSKIMFMDSWRSGELILNDHNIIVHGNGDSAHTGHKTAAAYLDGANITYNASVDGGKSRIGAIEVGVETRPTIIPDYTDAIHQEYTAGQYSRVYMFGGKITANTDSISHDVETSGIFADDCAYIQIVYGAIYSSTNCVRTNGALPHSYIEIVNGTFKTKSKTVGECIYMPSGKLNITGGTFEGHCCLAIRGGDTIISGGYFHSTGDHKDIDYAEDSASGLGSEGSVINIELSNGASDTIVYSDTKSERKNYAYGTNPSLTIHNATLYSDSSYILQVFRNNKSPTKTWAEVAVNQKLEVDFFGGVYYYAKEASTTSNAGVRIVDKSYLGVDVEDCARVYQSGGSWIKTK